MMRTDFCLIKLTGFVSCSRYQFLTLTPADLWQCLCWGRNLFCGSIHQQAPGAAFRTGVLTEWHHFQVITSSCLQWREYLSGWLQCWYWSALDFVAVIIFPWPTAEGRIESTTGNLMCSYHGWQFDNNGSCTSIPQTETTEQGALAMKSPRSCVASYPVKVEQVHHFNHDSIHSNTVLFISRVVLAGGIVCDAVIGIGPGLCD